MVRLVLFSMVFCMLAHIPRSVHASPQFRLEQKKFPRVRTAYAEKEKLLQQMLGQKEIHSFDLELYLRAFKAEQILEVWGKPKNDPRFVLLVSYPFSGYSGKLGPKKQQGDGQVPEGFYKVDRFNPESNFYLSLGLDYPNRADRKRAGTNNPGGDIFIHGNQVTIGCIPISDDKIKELYLLAVEARTHGQKTIPVHIFPFRFTADWLLRLPQSYAENNDLIDFWKNLAQGFSLFEAGHQLPRVTITAEGHYQFQSTPD